MGFQSEIIVSYDQCSEINIETIVNELLVSGWRLGVEKEIHARDINSKYTTLPYSLEGISSFHKSLSYQVEHKKHIGFDISNLAFNLKVSLSYNFEQPNILTFSLLNEDPKNRLISTIEEIRKYFNQVFNAIVTCDKVDKVQFVSGYDYEEVYLMKSADVKAYSDSLTNLPS